jgi:SIR2-like domain
MANALLIGNDINSLSPGYDWAQLLKDLIVFVGAQGKIADLREQFPLFYEEICIYAGRHGTRTENEIKQYIAGKVQKLRPNAIHSDLLSLDVGEILTTNYEFTLENSILRPSAELKNGGVVAERRYSIFRNYQVDDKRFWHIHGDAQNPNSVALGYEHYCGYLQSMRSYVVSGTGESYKNLRLAPLTKRLRSRSIDKVLSWLDVFFAHDIHIIGLGLDFVEIHLWWLLTFRARSANSRKSLTQNRVFYYYPAQREESDKIKLRFLGANGVTVQGCERRNGDKHGYYQNVISKIKRNMKSGS